MTTTITNQKRVYPGIICNGVEFFTTNGLFKVITNGNCVDFKDASYAIQKLLKDEMEKDPEVLQILQSWFPSSELKRLVQFGSCRFGGLDFKSDVIDFELQEGDYVECPLRDTCPGAGKICKPPKFNSNVISFQEVKLIQALVTTDTNENIAEKLSMCLGSLHLAKRNLYQKLKVQTKQEIAIIARDLNLI